MSVEKFKAAKKDLQFSYDLMEKMRPQPQMAGMDQNSPQGEEMGQMEEQPMEQEMTAEAPVEAPVEQEKGMIETIQEAVAPMFEKMSEKLTSLITKKDEEPKDAKITLDATVEPKKEDDETSKES